MNRWNRTFALAVTFFAASAVASVSHASLLSNGSFETGDFTGWTTGGNFAFSQVVSGSFSAYSGAQDGTFYATLGPVGSDGSLSQTFADVAGHTLHISGYIASKGDDPSDLSMFFNAGTLISLSDPNTGVNFSQLNFDVTATGSDTFSMRFRDDPSYIAIDNFVITDTSVPEPASLALLAAGLLGFAAVRRRAGS